MVVKKISKICVEKNTKKTLKTCFYKDKNVYINVYYNNVSWSMTVSCTGKPAKFTVVTTNAGAGTLAALIDGPSKVALVCSEVADGYEFSYTPMAPGNYMIMIKYSNITIAGAPFKAVVTGQ